MKTYTSRQATNKLLEAIEEGLLDKDTVIMACVKYMSEDDVADMCHINEFFTEDEIDFDQWDDSEYDVEAMKIDERNGNFDVDNSEEYRHENIVQASIMNGQFTQAREQCEKYGLNYEVEKARADQ
jgi:hypothetical protein